MNQVRVHIVVFHRVKNFFWIGQIPPPQLVHLSDYVVHFGKHEEIFDPFALRRIHSVLYPDEIAHFLSQIPTSRYLACPEERREWLTRNNVTIAEGKLTSSTEAIVGAKGLMKRLGMQFWMACGTLLGAVSNKLWAFTTLSFDLQAGTDSVTSLHTLRTRTLPPGPSTWTGEVSRTLFSGLVRNTVCACIFGTASLSTVWSIAF